MAMICTRCGTVRDQAERRKSGSTLLEVFLWFFGILPGIIYHIWRNSTKAKVCPSCGSTQIVGLSSPMGRKLQRELRSDDDYD
jgi:hypothetical protein